MAYQACWEPPFSHWMEKKRWEKCRMNTIYGRCSTDDQTVEQQVSACKALAELDGGELRVITEKRPGWEREGRAGYMRLRRLIENGECKKVFAWKLDRLGRKANEVLDFFRLCEKHGCAVVLVTEKIDTAGPFGMVIVYLLATVAEMETANIRLRTKAKFDQYRKEFDYKGHGSFAGWFSEKALKKERVVRALARDGMNKWSISIETKLDYRTVCKLLRTPEGQCRSKKDMAKQLGKWYKTPAEQRREYLAAHPNDRCRKVVAE